MKQILGYTIYRHGWECVTDIDKKQQGSVTYLLLLDEARSACRDIAVKDLNKYEDLSILINKIEIFYVEKASAYIIAYERFEIETFQRTAISYSKI